jgi:MoaA/NifB/PqqE/SkfB family radical SAM enzyme
VQAIDLAHSSGLKTRVITNGQQGFSKFLKTYNGHVLPAIGFSIDGAVRETHERIRGLGTFERLINNVERSHGLGYRSHAIISVSRQNSEEITQILDVCEQLQFAYVNVHYVTSRGFAPSEIVLSVQEWRDVCRIIRNHSRKLSVEIRLEETFSPAGAAVGSCAVRDQRSLLFFPDGRVFMCPMFIDVPNAHSFTWSKEGLLNNTSTRSEQQICASDESVTCPAMQFVNPDIANGAASKQYVIRCIFDKSKIVSAKRIPTKRG